MSIGRAIMALESLSAADLELVLSVGARLLARASEAPAPAPQAGRSSAAERARRYRQRHAEGVTERDGKRDGGRDASRLSVTESVTKRDGQRDGCRRESARGPTPDLSEISPSDLKDRSPQSDLQSVSDARAQRDASRVTEPRDASRVTGVTGVTESVTAAAERARAVVAEGYRSRGLAVPRAVASLASTAETAAALAGLPLEALEGILERFFADPKMRTKGYPAAFLLANPNQWGASAGGGRDEGESRPRPAETVLPDWMRGEA